MHIVYMKGRKNRKGQLAPWAIVDDETGAVAASFPTKKIAVLNFKKLFEENGNLDQLLDEILD